MVTADDFGLAEEINDAVEIAYREGILTAASLMVAGPAAEHAIRLARRLPDLRVGLHLVLVDGAPTLTPDAIPGLVDETGELRRDLVPLGFDLALRPALRRQLDREIAAQFEAFRKTGLPLDHVNAHKHFHVHPVVAGRVLALLDEHGKPPLRVPYEPRAVVEAADPGDAGVGIAAPWISLLAWRTRRAGIRTTEAVFGLRWSGHVSAPRLAALLPRLPSGDVEIYCHPATADRFPGHAQGYAYETELAALTDPAVAAAAESLPHRRGGYRDLA